MLNCNVQSISYFVCGVFTISSYLHFNLFQNKKGQKIVTLHPREESVHEKCSVNWSSYRDMRTFSIKYGTGPPSSMHESFQPSILQLLWREKYHPQTPSSFFKDLQTSSSPIVRYFPLPQTCSIPFNDDVICGWSPIPQNSSLGLMD